jgi:hypothetical protein
MIIIILLIITKHNDIVIEKVLLWLCLGDDVAIKVLFSFMFISFLPFVF